MHKPKFSQASHFPENTAQNVHQQTTHIPSRICSVTGHFALTSNLAGNGSTTCHTGLMLQPVHTPLSVCGKSGDTSRDKQTASPHPLHKCRRENDFMSCNNSGITEWPATYRQSGTAHAADSLVCSINSLGDQPLQIPSTKGRQQNSPLGCASNIWSAQPHGQQHSAASGTAPTAESPMRPTNSLTAVTKSVQPATS